MYLRTKKVLDWKQINFRNIESMLSVQFIYDLYDQYNSTINWFRFKNICLYYQNNKLWSYTPNDEWEKIISNIADQYKDPNSSSNPNIIEKSYWYYNRKETLLIKFLKDSRKLDLQKMNNSEIYNLLFNWYQITLNQIYFINLAPVELGLQRAISELGAEKYLTSEEISILYSLDNNTVVIQEEYAFLKSILNANDDNIERKINQHLKKYDYVTIGYGSKPIDRSILYRRYENIKKLDKNQIEKRIKDIENYPDYIKAKKEKILRKLDNPKLAELFDLAAKLGFMRDRKKALLGKSVQYRNLILDEVSRRYNFENEELKWYIMDDFYNLLILNEKLANKEIEHRKEGIYISNISIMSSGEEAREEYFENFKQEKEDASVLKKRKGICASSGVVRGKARICLTFEESNNLEKDEILITYGTDFDFMNAIVKSSGIITEEGGILSHASVISRELHKPCIIAFKGITKLIKDGDLIELNAEKGTVTLLEKCKENKVVNLIDGMYSLKDNPKVEEVGNKAYNLIKLHELKCNVPEAYFIGISFFKNLLLKENKYDEYLKYSNDLKKYKNNLYNLIDSIYIDPSIFSKILDFTNNTYAVRSSSPNEDSEDKSFAGQYVTELFCNSIEFVISSIKKCWKSLVGINMDKYKDDNDVIFGGIIIQKMVVADFSGVLFTKDPVTNNKDCMVIESCVGVASKLVDNKVVPDRYFINQNTLKVIDSINKNNIPESIIKELVKIGNKLEKEYGCDVDIEWACENDILYLIQCRPITT